MRKKITSHSYKKTILKLKSVAEKKESIRAKLAVAAKEKEKVRTKLVATAKQLAMTAKEKESIRAKLAVAAKEKEKVRTKLVITAKQLAMTAKEIKISEGKLQTLLDSIGDGVIAIDRSWNITLFNKAASAISGWQKKEVIGRSFREIIKLLQEQTRKENTAFIEQAMVYGRVEYMEGGAIMIKKDASEIPVGDSAAPIFDINKKVIGAIIIFRDATNEKEAQSLRSNFAYASHQLRTPVTEAIWSIESVLGETDAGKIKQELNTAYHSMQSVKKLVEQLLEVSEIDQGTVISRKKNVVMANLISEVVKGVKAEAQVKGINISVSPISPTLSFNTDARILTRILFEILDNAIQYTNQGGLVKMAVTPQKDKLLIEIQDSGIGIPAEAQPLEFTKFFRGSNFDKAKIPGAGLGLYISREYVKLLNGKIWFKSEEGKGSKFSVLL